MAAPVRYLSGRQQQQKIGIEGSTQNEKVLEVVGRVGIGTTIFEPDSELEIRGDVIVSGIITAGSIDVSSGEVSFDDVNVSGASTFTGPIDANGSLDVDGHTELDDVNVSGASTFTGAADFNGSLDVDGHTELDDLNVSGVTTTGGLLDINAGGQANTFKVEDLTDNRVVIAGTGGELEDDANLTFNGTQLAVGVDLDVDGHTELDSVNVSAASTFGGLVDINAGGQANTFKVEDLTDNRVVIAGTGGELEDDANLTFNGTQLAVGVDLDVDGHTELDDVNVSGASTFTGAIDANGNLDVDGHTELDDVNVSGASTFTGAADFNGDIDVDGHTELDDVNVSGASTFTGAADFNGNLDVDGHTELDDVNVSGASTFTGAADFNGDIDVDGHTELDNLNVSGVSTFVGVATFSTNDVYVAQRLFVGGVEVGGSTNTFAGINTFTDTTDNTLGDSNTGAVQINGGLGVDKNVSVGAGLSVGEGITVAGLSTFVGLSTFSNGDVFIAQRLFVGGLEVEGGAGENVFSGISTFTNQTDNVLGNSDTGATHFNGGIGIDKNATVGAGLSVVAGFEVGGVSTFTGNIDANGNLDVDGHTELDDVNVSGAITATTFTGNLAGTVNTTAQPNITSLGTLTGLDVNGHTELDNVNASGISSATAFANFDYLQAPFGSTVNLSVVVGSKDSTHRYNGTGSGSAYIINGVQSPFLTLTPGRTYRFNLSSSDQSSHPFRFYLEADKTTQYTTNVTTASTYTEITITDETPVVLHYQCSAHGYMGNAVQTNSNVVNTNYAATLRDSLTVSGDINANGDIVGDSSTNITGMSGVTASTLTGTLQTAAQTNITSVGTLGSLTVSGDINANGNIVGDNATNITGIAGVTASTLTGTLQTAAQTNITSVGTLTGLEVNGHSELDGVNVSTALTAASLNVTDKLTTTGIGISVANSGLRTAYIEGPEEIWIDPHPAGAGATSGSVRIRGDLYVDGTEFIVDVDKIELGDFNIGIASTVPTNALLDGAGLGIGAESIRKTITWNNATSALMSSENWNLASGKHYEINGTDVLTSTTLGSGVVNSSLTSVGTLTGLDVNGHTELDDVNVSGILTATTLDVTGGGGSGGQANLSNLSVSGVSTFSGNVDVNAALDVSGNITGTGDFTLTDTDAGSAAGPELKLYRNSSSPADADYLGQIKFAGESDTGVERNYAKITGKILDASNGTEDGIIEFAHIKAGSQTITGRFRSDSLQLLNGTALSVDGDITATSDINANGNIVGDNSTNISGINQVTATTFSGNATSATTATNLAGGDTGDIPYQSSNGTTTFVDASGAANNQVLLWSGSAPVWANVSAGAGALSGISVQEEGSTVGTANSITVLNFVGDNVTATASGNNTAIITLSGTPTFSSLNVTGISTIPSVTGPTTFTGGDVNVGAAVTIDPTSGIISATAFYGSGENLTDLINQRIEGLQVFDEGTPVGTGFTFAGLDFVGPGVTVTSTGIGTTATITIPGFSSDADENLIAGTCAGGTYDPSSGTACFNIFLGSCAGKNITEGDYNIFLGEKAGCENTTGNKNVFLGNNVGLANTTGSCNNMIGVGAGQCATVTGSHNTFFGTDAGRCATGSGNYNNFIGINAGCVNTTGNQNIFIGNSAGRSNTTGSCNNMMGVGAGSCATVTGSHNTFLGTYAGKCATSTGDYNNFIGANAGFNNTTGGCNVFLGNKAGCENTTGHSNTFVGLAAGFSNTDGDLNTFIGQNVGLAVTTGCCNTMIGNGAGKCATVTGQNNTFLGTYSGKCASGAGNCNNIIGFCAGRDNQGTMNNFMGRCAGLLNTSGTYNNFIGERAGSGWNGGSGTQTGAHNNFFGSCAGCDNQSGGCNNFIGRGTGKFNLTGEQNVYIGDQVGGASTTASGNVMIGKCTGASAVVTGSDNIFFGTDAGKCASGSGACNTFIGYNAGQVNSSGSLNNFIGRGTGQENTIGNSNVFLGHRAGNCNTEGSVNVFIGSYAGRKNTTAHDNVFLGNQAGLNGTTGCYNIFFGKCTAAGGTVTGGCNVAAGRCAGYNLTSGCDNVFLGYDAGYTSADASRNVFIGQQAGCLNTSGDNNIAIGYQVSLPSATGSCQLAIGNGSDRWIAGDSSFNVTVSTASTFSSSGINVVGVVTATDFNSTSDARLKTNVQVIPNPLDKIVRIDGVSFNWIKDNKPSMGVIADNIQEVLPELVSDTDPKTVNYNGLIGLLIEVVKEQQTQINSLNERLSQLE